MKRTSRRLLIHLGLALALVLAQAGALLHLASHGKAAHNGSATHAQLCGQCLGSSTVLGAAGVSHAPLSAQFLRAAGPITTEHETRCAAAVCKAFRSRAPPIPA